MELWEGATAREVALSARFCVGKRNTAKKFSDVSKSKCNVHLWEHLKLEFDARALCLADFLNT
jgi:hypothetical protein